MAVTIIKPRTEIETPSEFEIRPDGETNSDIEPEFKPESEAKKSGHSKPLPPVDLNVPGWLYVGHLMTHYHIGHSTVYARIRNKLLPKPDGMVGRRPYWRSESIRQHLSQ